MQAYRDNVAIGLPVASTCDIGGIVRWGSRYDIYPGVGWYDWYSIPIAVWLGNIALDATQRAGLHAAMMGLPSA